jgi:hypothetical protein
MKDDPAAIWYFEPKYHRLASSTDEYYAEHAERHLETEILFFADLVETEDCLWVYFPETPTISRFWRTDEAAAAVAEQNPETIFFYAELVPPKAV